METTYLKTDGKSQKQLYLRIKVWDLLKQTGYASLATESTVSQMIEMVMNGKLETEEQLAGLLGIKSEHKGVDVEDHDNSLDERILEDSHIEIDIDQSTVSCVELASISENGIKLKCDTTFEKPSTSQTKLDKVCCEDRKKKIFKKEKKLHNSCSINISSYSGLELNKTRIGKKCHRYETRQNSPFRSTEIKNSIPVQKKGYKSKKSNFQLGLENDNECPTCGKTFNDHSAMRTHLLTHTTAKPYPCLTCGKAFSCKSNLYRHSRTHSGKKPYMCLTCRKTFTRNETLYDHSRGHFGEKPYKCLPCGKSFAHRPSLRQHSRTHSGEKSYRCRICGKAFVQNSSMNRHLKIHSRKTSYSLSA